MNDEEVVFIGDSNLDIESAHEFNLFTFAVLTGMGTPDVLCYSNPGEYAKDIIEVEKKLTSVQPNWEQHVQEHRLKIDPLQ